MESATDVGYDHPREYKLLACRPRYSESNYVPGRGYLRGLAGTEREGFALPRAVVSDPRSDAGRQLHGPDLRVDQVFK